MKDYPHLMLLHTSPFCIISPSWDLNQVFSNAQNRRSTWCAKGDPLLAVSRSVISFSSTQPVVRAQHCTAGWQWQSTRQAHFSLDCAELLLVFIINLPMSKTRALLCLALYKQRPKCGSFHLISSSASHSAHREDPMLKSCVKHRMQSFSLFFLANARTTEALGTLSKHK